MTSRARKYLSDVLSAIDLIEQYTRPVQTFEQYAAPESQSLRDAVERRLSIIGEAINQYRRESGSAEVLNTRQIVQLRNMLVHAYDSVHHPTIWNVVRRHLPTLRAEVVALLAAP